MNIEERLSRLERSNRRYRIGILAALACAILIGFDGAPPEKVVARSFEVVDSLGNTRASLTGNGDLWLYDLGGDPVASLSSSSGFDNKGAGSLTLFARNGEDESKVDMQVMIGTGPRGFLNLFDQKGKMTKKLP